MPLFDWRRPWPLLIVLVLHAMFFHAMQAGLLHRVAEAPVVREVLATLIAPEPLPAIQPPRIEPPRAEPARPLRTTKVPAQVPDARPATPPAAPPAPIEPMPSETAITRLAAPPEGAPAPTVTTPAPAVPPATRAPVANALPEPEPVTPPRFDAAYLKNPAPVYPPLSRRSGEQGNVTLRVRVTEDGHAAEISVRTSSGSPRLDEAAQAAVREWRFVPAKQGDQAVAAWVLVPLVFKLEG
jgi:protein TonB